MFELFVLLYLRSCYAPCLCCNRVKCQPQVAHLGTWASVPAFRLRHTLSIHNIVVSSSPISISYITKEAAMVAWLLVQSYFAPPDAP